MRAAVVSRSPKVRTRPARPHAGNWWHPGRVPPPPAGTSAGPPQDPGGHATRGVRMQIDKGQILDLLRQRGDQDSAQRAEAELPDQVDTDQHGDLLSKFGLSVP